VKKFLLILFLLAVPFSLFAQEDSTAADDYDFKWEWNDFIHFSDFHKAPTVSLDYGKANLNNRSIGSDLADNYSVEAKIGYTYEDEMFFYDNIIKYRSRYLLLSNFSKNFGKLPAGSNGLESDMWRFGIVHSNGYGYRLGTASIIPYHSGSFIWSRINFENELIHPSDRQNLEMYDESFRFGTSSQTGIRIRAISGLVFEAGYERSLIFSRHLFWKWSISSLIEVASQGLLDNFVNRIMKSSPGAAPVMSAILKGALSYGIYELRQSNMNWPYDTEPPLAYDQFKFGMSFVF
jgi:hypothetical protein